ncbi:NAD(P)-binding domain-containing protein [Rhodoligotrophos defluvii]|uniref:NAD(P)-binding domain-containing protein n=1 Tax=Rhodoligotrophos defluvii TaxID=2561934 RepID=UPI001485510F|nr:NAD(P)-binding domain-containing protein [Rhodoligotrophos defluvii]
MNQEPPYLTEEKIRAIGLTYPEVLDALRQAFARRAEAADPVVAKIGLHTAEGGLFHAMPGVLDDIAVVKWVASTVASTAAGKHINAQVIATNAKTAETLAILDFSWLTGVRTAAVSALGADFWADPKAESVAMIGCGLQARTHLDALLAVRPIKRIIALSRTEASARKYAEEVAARGLDVTVVNDRPDAVYEADIVVSMVPLNIAVVPFVDGGKIKPGGLAIGVDLAKSWIPEGVAKFDALTTDDALQTAGLVQSGMVTITRAFDSDLPEAVAGRSRVTWSADRRIGYVPPGLALADAAVTRVVLQKLGMTW